MNNSITDIKEIISSLKKEDRKILDRIFSIDVSFSKINLPIELKEKMKEKFEMSELENQKIIRIDNKIDESSTIFNSLRAKRPQQSSSQEIDLQKTDAFDSPETSTPYDLLGRIEGKHTTTAANLMSYNKHHSLIIFKNHNPLNISFEEFSEAIDTAKKWFYETNKKNPKAIHPILIWNYLWKAGASIIHPHMQMMLSENPFPVQRKTIKIKTEYRKKYKRDYFSDFIKIHDKLDLSIKDKDINIISPLTPIKERELIIFGEFGVNLKKSLYKIIQSYKKAGVESFDMAFIMPSLKKGEFKTFVRIVDRGKLSTTTADFGSMEVYSGTHIVSSDPYEMIKLI